MHHMPLMSKLSIHNASTCLFMIFFISLVIRTKCACDQTKNAAALFVFGDSLFDPGNNNYFNTPARANYFPYGETFFKYPTGRFSNGRLIPDFVAEYAKLPLIPPYLHPGYVDFTSGANFASAGAGALIETHQGIALSLRTQVGYFKNVSRLLRLKLGDAVAITLLSRAVYLFNVGINDYMSLFNSNSTTFSSFSTKEFVGMVIGNISSVIEEIYEVGGRKFGFQTVRPIACAPNSRVLAEGKYNESCLDQGTPFVLLHNIQLSKLLKKLNTQLKGFKYSLNDYNTFLQERMDHPSKYGFKEGMVGCCGSGPYQGIFNCGGKRAKEYFLCGNVSEYVFFDSSHSTERVYQQFTEQTWSKEPSPKGSYNLRELFTFN
ncbi:GDSL esterase/lipase 1-like [Humulus lupulus]|uniref:GDSL esterase/lipase 1-like n=1 Tax=Humulus lupulus TaxID=3486 RepID=UPI002B40F527|nr:GDSL esterase/lipase 1-like [Humulus lupulus]